MLLTKKDVVERAEVIVRRASNSIALITVMAAAALLLSGLALVLAMGK